MTAPSEIKKYVLFQKLSSTYLKTPINYDNFFNAVDMTFVTSQILLIIELKSIINNLINYNFRGKYIFNDIYKFNDGSSKANVIVSLNFQH